MKQHYSTNLKERISCRLILIFLVVLVSSNFQLAKSQSCTNAVQAPATINGVNVTGSGSGSVGVWGAVYNDCSNTVSVPAGALRLGGAALGAPNASSSFSYTYTFSQPVQNLVFIMGAMGSSTAGATETVTFSTNGGTPSLSTTTSCSSTISGNSVTGGGVNNSTGGGIYTVTAPSPFTTITFTGAGGYGGTIFALCESSVVVACTAPSAVTVSGTQTYCQNASATALTSSFTGTATGAAYQWYAGASAISGATSITYTPPTTAAGTVNYTVKVTNGCGNSTSTNYPVTINATPSAPVITKVDATCAVSTGTINVSSPVSGITYTLSPGGATSTTGSFTGLTAGSGPYTVTASIGSCTSGISNSVTLNASPPGAPATPTLSAPAQPTCSVSTGSFTISNYDPTYTYTISPSAGVTQSGATITAPAGSYTVTATNSSCTSGASSAVTLNASVAPTAPTLSTTTITNSCPCENGTVNLNTLVTSTAPAGSILEWHTSATPTAGNLVADPTKAPSGTYYAFYFNGSCYSAAGTPVTATATNCAATVPNLVPTIDIDGASFGAGQNRDFVVNLYEINNAATTGTITFKINKLSIYAITYPTASGSSVVLGGTANENSNWTFTEDASFITVTSKPGITISAGGQAVIGFKVTRSGGAAFTIQNLSAIISTGAGSETDASDNTAIKVIVTN